MIQIDGRLNSNVLVQERYDSTRVNYEEFISDTNPFAEDLPDKYTDEFVPIRMVANKIIDPTLDLSELAKGYSILGTVDTGALEYGNANPKSPQYNSLADFCFGTNAVEIRIPWQMLNFSDPSRVMVHNDYYPLYGVQDLNIDGIYMGLSVGTVDSRIEMVYYALSGWGDSISYTERLKQSYYILQDAWVKE